MSSEIREPGESAVQVRVPVRTCTGLLKNLPGYANERHKMKDERHKTSAFSPERRLEEYPVSGTKGGMVERLCPVPGDPEMSLECTNGTLFVERKRTMRVFLARFPCVPRGSASGRRPPGGAPRAGRGPQSPTRRGIGAPALSSRRPRLPAGAGGAIAVYAGAARRCSSPRAKTASLNGDLRIWIFGFFTKRRRAANLFVGVPGK